MDIVEVFTAFSSRIYRTLLEIEKKNMKGHFKYSHFGDGTIKFCGQMSKKMSRSMPQLLCDLHSEVCFGEPGVGSLVHYIEPHV